MQRNDCRKQTCQSRAWNCGAKYFELYVYGVSGLRKEHGGTTSFSSSSTVVPVTRQKAASGFIVSQEKRQLKPACAGDLAELWRLQSQNLKDMYLVIPWVSTVIRCPLERRVWRRIIGEQESGCVVASAI